MFLFLILLFMSLVVSVQPVHAQSNGNHPCVADTRGRSLAVTGKLQRTGPNSYELLPGPDTVLTPTEAKTFRAQGFPISEDQIAVPPNREECEKEKKTQADKFRQRDRQKAASRVQSQYEREVKGKASSGTAWLVKHPYEHRSYAVTNYHVVAGRYKFILITPKGRILPAKIVSQDKHNDLVVLEILEPNLMLPKLPLSDAVPEMGTKVFTIGYPHPGLMGAMSKLTDGIISSLNGARNDPRTFQITVPIQKGNSGGPLLNMRGEVVGVVQSKLSARYLFKTTRDLPQNVNYAIKGRHLRSLLLSLPPHSISAQSSTQQLDTLDQLGPRIEQSVMIVVAR